MKVEVYVYGKWKGVSRDVIDHKTFTEWREAQKYLIKLISVGDESTFGQLDVRWVR